MRKIKLISVLATTIAINCLGGSLFHTAAEESILSWQSYTQIDDKGLLDYNNGEYKVFLKSEDSIVYVDIMENYFAFTLNENIAAENVHDDIIKIISEYYPDNNLASTYPTGDEVSCYIEFGNFENIILYMIEDRTNGENTSEYTNNIMKKLNEKGLISSFYNIGEVGLKQYIYNNYPNAYKPETIDVLALEDYIAKNTMNCSLVIDSKKYPFDVYNLIFENELTIEENFEIAIDLYEALNIKPLYFKSDSGNMIFGENSLKSASDITKPFETTTTTTTPTKTTVTTISTTVTTQPTEPANPIGDADGDNEVTVRDCSHIAIMIAEGKTAGLPENADFNKDGKVNVRDAAAIARSLAEI